MTVTVMYSVLITQSITNLYNTVNTFITSIPSTTTFLSKVISPESNLITYLPPFLPYSDPFLFPSTAQTPFNHPSSLSLTHITPSLSQTSHFPTPFPHFSLHVHKPLLLCIYSLPLSIFSLPFSLYSPSSSSLSQAIQTSLSCSNTKPRSESSPLLGYPIHFALSPPIHFVTLPYTPRQIPLSLLSPLALLGALLPIITSLSSSGLSLSLQRILFNIYINSHKGKKTLKSNRNNMIFSCFFYYRKYCEISTVV